MLNLYLLSEYKLKQVIMAKDKNKSSSKLEKELEEKKQAAIHKYEDLIGRLEIEREQIEDEFNSEYLQARKHVRSNPEESMAFSFVGGLAIGFILAKISGK